MKKYLNLLSKTVLFQGIPEDVILLIATSRCCHTKTFPAGRTIYESGQHIRHLGVVLEGTIDIVHTSSSGHDTIVSRLTPGSLLGESFSCAGEANAYNDVRSITGSALLMMDVPMLLHGQACLGNYHLKLIENIMHCLAKSNIWLNTKILLLTQKTLRDKLLTYFEILAAKNTSREFVIPFHREQLANFLGSERSSVSRELSRMQEEGILTIERDYVVLL